MDELSHYFDILEVRRGASLEEIKRAYRDLAQVWHPDRYAHNPRLRAKAEEKLKDLNEAYQRVSAYIGGSSVYTPPPPKTAPPPPTKHTSTAQTAGTEPRETNSPPPKPPPSSAGPASTAKTSSNAGPIVVVAVVLAIVILISVSQQGSKIRETPDGTGSQPSRLLPTTSIDRQELPAMKAQIEERVASKDAEFDRLQRWYQQGVSSSDEPAYRVSLERARQEEQDIATLILAYNEKKKKPAPVAPSVKTYNTSPPSSASKSAPTTYRTPRSAFVRPETAPNGQPWPAYAAYISGYQVLAGGGLSSVTVDNTQNSSDVFLKLVSLKFSQPHPVRLCYIPAYSQFKFQSVAAGRYDVRYRDLSSGGYSKTEEFTLTETRTYQGAEFSNLSLSLYKVANGNMHTKSIDESEF